MTVWQLIQALSLCDPNDKVVIPVEVGHVTIGRLPNLPVDSVRRGHDWDDKTVFLNVDPEKRLTPMQKGEYIELIRYKQLVSGLRGKQDIEHLSDVFVRKDFVLNRLSRLVNVEELEPFEVSDLITDIREEKL